MEQFEQKALDYYGEIVIEKDLIHQAGFGARSIPTYVGEWILSNFVETGHLTEQSRQKIAEFLAKYLPAKGQKEEIKNKLFNMETVELLDDYSVEVNLKQGQRRLRIPLLDMNDGFIIDGIVNDNELMLTSGVWGIGELSYVPPSPYGESGQVWMRSFKPFQIHSIDVEYYAESRKYFETSEWIDLIVSSIGFNPKILSERQKIVLLMRIIPLIEPRVNMVELAPKGTGKSFVFDNLSRYARVIGGGKVTPAVLFHNISTSTPGIVTRYDAIVLDEIQSVTGDSAGEVVASLRVYLESGRFSRGKTMGTAECGFVMIGNISLDENRRPLHSGDGIFNEIPNFMRETAFIDRLHGLIPGWDLPRVTKDTPSKYLGFKGDFFSEILHLLRKDVRFTDYVSINMQLENCPDLRDRKAITRLATGFLKLLFPNLQPSHEDFINYCVKPAVELRQRVRDELHKMDPEYPQVTIGIVGSSSSIYPEQKTAQISTAESLKPVTIQSSTNSSIGFQRTVLIDVNNVACCNVPVESQTQFRTPRYGQILMAENYFKNQGYEVHLIADSGLWRYVDNKAEFKKRDERCEIKKSPAGIPADVYILTLANEDYPNSTIVTNDTYRQHLELKEKFLLNGGHFQRYTIENGKFMPLSY
jgi:ATP-dependent Lon protease